MAKTYTLSIVEHDAETNESKEVYNEDYSGLCIMAECLDDEGCAEILVNTSITSIAAMISCAKKVKTAATMAIAVDLTRSVGLSGYEEMLAEKIKGDMQ